MEDFKKTLKDAGVDLGSWGSANPNPDIFKRERDLLEKLEKVLLVQIEADKAKITDLQVAMNKLEKNRGR